MSNKINYSKNPDKFDRFYNFIIKINIIIKIKKYF